MAERSSRGKRPLVLALTAGLTLAGTGVAFAYWTSTGSGQGEAETGVNAAFTIVAAVAEGGPLSPGGLSQTVDFTVTNPGAGTLLLQGVTVAVANANGTAWTAVAGCSAADYTATLTTDQTVPREVAGSGTVTGTATLTMVNRNANQDGCQGADVPLYFRATTPA